MTNAMVMALVAAFFLSLLLMARQAFLVGQDRSDDTGGDALFLVLAFIMTMLISYPLIVMGTT